VGNTEKGTKVMTLMVSIARISHKPDAATIQAFHAEHDAMLGDYAGPVKILDDPNDPNQIAVVVDVHDLEGLRQATRTPEGDAMMRKYGFLEELSYFLET